MERVVITRLVDHTYYSRIVLKLPGGTQRSIDSRPSDSLALAMQCEAPLFVARELAKYASIFVPPFKTRLATSAR